MKRKLQMLALVLVLPLLTFCGKDAKVASSQVTDEASAENFFRTNIQYGDTAGANAKYATTGIQTILAEEPSGHAIYSKTNLFLMGDNSYIIEFIKVERTDRNKGPHEGKTDGAVVEGKWHVSGKSLVLDGFGTGAASSAPAGEPSVVIDIDKGFGVPDLAGKQLSFARATYATRFLTRSPRDLKKEVPHNKQDKLEQY
jgi:hypothetical protein